MIPFNSVPANVRVPGLFAELDATGAASSFGGQRYRCLVFGQKLAAGTVAANEPKRVTRAEEARLFFGEGSMLHASALALFANSQTVDATFIAMDDPGSGVQAAGSYAVTSAPTASGTAFLYVAGMRVQVGVTANQTAAQVATAIAAAINAKYGKQVDAAVDGGNTSLVNVTAKHKGTCGNGLRLSHSHLEGEFLPAGLALTVTQFANGSGTPDLATALANTGGDHFILMAVPYTDTALLDTLETDLASRNSATRMIRGQAITATPLAYASALAFGDGRNSEFVTCMSSYGSPTSPWEWAAAIMGQVAESAEEHPARPFQTLHLAGVMAPQASDRYGLEENNALLHDGIATHYVDSGGRVLIQRLITMYQEDSTGGDDIALLDLNTPLILERLRSDVRTRFSQKYPRAMLANDGARTAAGQAVVTPATARAELIGLFEGWLEFGLVEAPAQFEEDLIVERNAQDPNRLDMRLRPNLMNQMRVFGAQIAFIL